MRFVTINGQAGAGKTEILKILAENAGQKIMSGNELEAMIRLHKRGTVQVQPALQTFVDEVSVAQKKLIEDFGKEFSDDYVTVLVRAA